MNFVIDDAVIYKIVERAISVAVGDQTDGYGRKTDIPAELVRALRDVAAPRLTELIRLETDAALSDPEFQQRLRDAIRAELVAAATRRVSGAVKTLPKPALGDLERMLRGREP